MSQGGQFRVDFIHKMSISLVLCCSSLINEPKIPISKILNSLFK